MLHPLAESPRMLQDLPPQEEEGPLVHSCLSSAEQKASFLPHLSLGRPVDVDDESDTARVLLEARVVEAVSLGQLPARRVEGHCANCQKKVMSYSLRRSQ